MRVNYVMVFVKDMDRAVSFYRDVVGLPLKSQSPGWTEFATDGATLALHLAEVESQANHLSQVHQAGTCRPGFSVQDLDEFHERMTSQHVVCTQAPKSIFGSRVAQYADPDGLIFAVGEERRGS